MLKLLTLVSLFLLFAAVRLVHAAEPRVSYIQQTEEPVGFDRAGLIAFAKKYLGTPYRYASSNPKKGFDCSGFVNFVFRNFKIDLPRSSREFGNMGNSLKPEEFKVGDVVVFYSFRNKARIGHVGIICEANGLKSKFIHSSSGQKRGIMISDLASVNYAKRFYKCVDVIDKKQ